MSGSSSVAPISKRVISFMIDDMVIAIFIVVIFYKQLQDLAILLQSATSKEEQKGILDAFILQSLPIVVAIKVLYHSLLIWQTGMTVGKYIARIKVVDSETQGLPSLWQSLWRGSIRIMSEALLYVGFIFALVSPQRQTLHDKLSNCVVIDV